MSKFRQPAAPRYPWAVFERTAPGNGRACWKRASEHANAHAAAREARRMWESTGREHCASGND